MNARKLLKSKLLQQSMLLVKQHASYYNREQYQALVCRLNLQNSIYLYKLPFTHVFFNMTSPQQKQQHYKLNVFL